MPPAIITVFKRVGFKHRGGCWLAFFEREGKRRLYGFGSTEVAAVDNLLSHYR